MAIAFNEDSTVLLSKLQPLWHDSAPRRVVKKSSATDPFGGWAAWQAHVSRRKRPRMPKFLTGSEPSVLWGWRGDETDGQLAASIAEPKRIADAVLSAGAPIETSSQALELVALAYALPNLTASLSAESWWQLVELLHEVATDAQVLRVHADGEPSDVLRHELLAGELPLALGYLFPEVRPLRALRKAAQAALSESLIELTDGQGLPHARLLPVYAPLFACWTRCRWLGRRIKGNCWSGDAEVQYEWLIRHALRLADVHGHFMLTDRKRSDSARWPGRLFEMALELAGDRNDRAAAAAALPGHVVPRKAAGRSKDLPHPSFNSEWSSVAVLGSGWKRSDVRLAVNYADDPTTIELWLGREQILAGQWTCDVTCDGQPARPVGAWEELCWESDAACDFLELGVQLSGGLRLERQLMLGRKDRVLYLADVVVTSDRTTRQLSCSLQLPIARGANWQPEKETRDGHLIVGKQSASVLPLALREWRSDPRGGSLTFADGRLTLNQETTGRAICCPLLFDLKPRCAQKNRTWRQLTVAEALQVVPPDVAVGYRAQSGRDQWLIYRSLAPASNRTVIGQNISGEFCAGRFPTTGKLDEWIEIEAP